MPMRTPTLLIICVLVLASAGALALSKTTRVIEITRPLAMIRVAGALITHYSSEPDQTDETPFITASNKKVYDGLIANNCWKFGTKVRIKDREYVVDDRMNKRYGCENFDIWEESTQEAIEAGRYVAEVFIYEK